MQGIFNRSWSAPERFEEYAEVAEVIDDVSQENSAEEVWRPGVSKNIPAASVVFGISVA